ncbi:MAG: 6-pyruvoyltetrahydropterin/6-carboxytetrahydropterin synthase [Bacteroidota bacterium]|nr:6-pyruvoyltetrahydropterin/6-carboxytetrahydropterin synthase [Bacteroidota bacterium]
MDKIAREYKWEMSHRLPSHNGPCRNIHGHSYKMRVSLEGELNKDSMVLDFYDMDNIFNPLVSLFDHAFLCDSEDIVMLNFLSSYNFKYLVIPETSTAENIAHFIVTEVLSELQKFQNLKWLEIRLYETLDAFAEVRVKIQ